MTLFNKYLYPVLTLVFLTFALVAGGILLKQNQDLRRKAEGGCASGKRCEITCDAAHPNRDSSECKCWDDHGGAQSGACVDIQGGVVPTAGGSSAEKCGIVDIGGRAYDAVSRCTYECKRKSSGGVEWIQYGECLPVGTAPITPPTGTYLTNGTTGQIVASPGQWTSDGKNVNANGATSAMCPNDSTKSVIKYLKFTCPNGCPTTTEGGVTAGRCYENRQESTTMPSLNGACGQVDALTTGDTFCGYTEYTCDQVRCRQTPTNPPQSTNTPTPTRTPTPTPTATNTSTPTPAKINCGASPCTINSCAAGLVCVTTAGGVNYCSQSANQEACIANPSVGSCCQQPTNTPVPPTNTPNPTNTPVPPTGTPNSCNGTCGSDGNCQSGLTCYLGFCRNPNNPSDSGCNNKGEPNSCNGTCGSDTNCKSGLVCSSGYCRNPNNPTNVNCQEKTVAKGPTPTRIILPVSGNTTPLTGITIVGSIVTLLGILLIL